MDEIEKFLETMFEENKDNLNEVLKKALLKEICFGCYEIMFKSVMVGKEMTKESLYEEVLRVIEKEENAP